jgi:enterobactin synthetase component D
MSPHRYPLWPDGIVGSISHTHRYVGVALARTRNYLGLGLDLEVRNSVTPDLFESILVGSEMKQLSTRVQVELATVLFSCKEAIFKAVNPVFNEFIDFLDVEVDVSDGRFRARCSEARHSAEMVNGGEGYFEIVGEIVKSLFLVHANPRAPA